MYTIILDSDKSLICTHRETIMQRSKLCDKLLFLVPREFEEYDLGEFEVNLEYVLPISRKYTSVLLDRQDGLYEGEYYRYILEADTDITAENGMVEMQLSFINVTTGVNGEVKTVVFKTQPCSVAVTPLADWAQYVSDKELTKIDQRITEIAAVQAGIIHTQEELAETQKGIIDDDSISDKKTYSSKKIERLFDSETEVHKDEIDDMFDGETPENDINRDIDKLFDENETSDSGDDTDLNDRINDLF